MSSDNFISQGKRNRWLDDATRYIRCKADRTAVRLELFNHISDRSDALRARGLDAGEAMSRAVDAMGDARELGRELGKLHRPGWGRAHAIARVLAILLILCVVSPFNKDNLELVLGQDTSIYMGPATSGLNQEEARTLSSPPAPPRMETTEYGSTIDTVAEYDLRGSVRASGHSITIPAAWLEQRVYYDDAGQPTTVSNTLVLYIKASTPLLWGLAQAEEEMAARHIITDCDGIRYSDRRYTEKVERVFNCTPYQGKLGTTWYRLRLGLGNQEPPASLTIPLGHGDLTLHVDLEKGSVS